MCHRFYLKKILENHFLNLPKKFEINFLKDKRNEMFQIHPATFLILLNITLGLLPVMGYVIFKRALKTCWKAKIKTQSNGNTLILEDTSMSLLNNAVV